MDRAVLYAATQRHVFHTGLRKVGRVVRLHDNGRGDVEVVVITLPSYRPRSERGMGGTVTWFGENIREATPVEMASAERSGR
jgi:hypothetical protein